MSLIPNNQLRSAFLPIITATYRYEEDIVAERLTTDSSIDRSTAESTVGEVIRACSYKTLTKVVFPYFRATASSSYDARDYHLHFVGQRESRAARGSLLCLCGARERNTIGTQSCLDALSTDRQDGQSACGQAPDESLTDVQSGNFSRQATTSQRVKFPSRIKGTTFPIINTLHSPGEICTRLPVQIVTRFVLSHTRHISTPRIVRDDERRRDSQSRRSDEPS